MTKSDVVSAMASARADWELNVFRLGTCTLEGSPLMVVLELHERDIAANAAKMLEIVTNYASRLLK